MQEALPLVLGAPFLLFRKNPTPELHNSPSSLNQVCLTRQPPLGLREELGREEKTPKRPKL